MLAATIGILLIFLPRGMPGRWLGVVWLCPLFLTPAPRPAQGEFWLTLLDVGQGLAAVIHTREHVLVYDTGARFSASFDAGRAVVTPYLRHHGLGQVDIVLISHGDNDHIGGLPGLLEEVSAGRILTSVPERVRHPRVEPCAAGQAWTWDGVTFEVLHPAEQGAGKENNQSCVLRVSTGKFAALLPGDIEEEAEQSLVENRVEKLRAQVLVAPHHGSRSSSSAPFIEAVSPEYVLYPVGYRNRFKFPHSEVMERYRRRGVKEINSTEAGAIHFRIGNSLKPPEEYRRSHGRYWHDR